MATRTAGATWAMHILRPAASLGFSAIMRGACSMHTGQSCGGTGCVCMRVFAGELQVASFVVLCQHAVHGGLMGPFHRIQQNRKRRIHNSPVPSSASAWPTWEADPGAFLRAAGAGAGVAASAPPAGDASWKARLRAARQARGTHPACIGRGTRKGWRVTSTLAPRRYHMPHLLQTHGGQPDRGPAGGSTGEAARSTGEAAWSCVCRVGFL